MRKKDFLILVGLLAFLPALSAQQTIPSGTVLPVALRGLLSSSSSRPGQTVKARLMQSVPSAGLKVGAKVVGHVVSVAPASGGAMAAITLEFDKVEASGRSIPIVADLRALASPFEVEQAQIPLTGPDRGTPEEAWETVQVGGDVVYRGGGPVMENALKVGEPVANGVLVRLQAGANASCRASLDGNNEPQALWVFSANACGTYGYSDVSITHAGRTNPSGQITLSSSTGNVTLRGGSGMLLLVVGGNSNPPHA